MYLFVNFLINIYMSFTLSWKAQTDGQRSTTSQIYKQLYSRKEGLETVFCNNQSKAVWVSQYFSVSLLLSLACWLNYEEGLETVCLFDFLLQWICVHRRLGNLVIICVMVKTHTVKRKKKGWACLLWKIVGTKTIHFWLAQTIFVACCTIMFESFIWLLWLA